MTETPETLHKLTPKEELIETLRNPPKTTLEQEYQFKLEHYQGQIKHKLNQNYKVTHNEVAKKLMEIDHYKTMRDTKEIYIYRNGIYEKDGEAQIEENVQTVYIEKNTRRFTAEVIAVIQRSTKTKRELFDADPNLITVKNGILNIETKTLTEHSPEHLSIRKFNLTYNPEATPEKILKFLTQVCPKPEFRITLIEMIAYCLLNHHKYHVWMILVGGGDNGKTTFLNLLKAFLTKKNTRSIKLQDLLTKRFLLALLYGKMANICDDLPKTPLKYTGIIKTLTGEGQITCDVKHRGPITFTSTTKQIFACNTLPKTKDKTHAFFSRPLIIEFNQKFLKGAPDTDPDIIDKLTTPEELSGLLNLCLDAIKNIKNRGRISYPFTTEEMSEQYQRFSDPLAEYFYNNVKKAPDRGLTKGQMFDDYAKYADDHKLTILASNVFSRKIRPFIIVAGGRDGFIGKDRAWHGVRLITEEEKEKKKGIDEY